MFLVSGGFLDAYRWRHGRCEGPLRFEAGAAGLERFSAHLAGEPPDPVRVLVDLVEEEFREDTVPHVIGPDRRALVQTRRRRLFSDSTYGCSLGRGREKTGRRDDRILFTALTRPERLAPWLEAIARNRVPLAGVHSLPLLTEQMLVRIPVRSSPALVVTWQHAGGLRQTYFVDGRVKLSRLAVPPRLESGERAVYLQSEVEKVRRYLARQSLLAADLVLDVYVVSNSRLEEAVGRLSSSSAAIRYRLVPLSELGRRLGVEDAHDLDWCDRLFIALLARHTPRHQYAPAREIQDYALHKVRSGLRAASVFAVGAGLLGGVSGLAGGYSAGRFAESLGTQAELYRQRYNEARERLPPIPAELPVMQLVVETAEGLRAIRTSPDAVLLALSRSLDLHPAVRLESIDWSAESGPGPLLGSAGPHSSGSDPGMERGTTASGRTSIQSTDIRGRIEPFDGDYRRALEQVGGLADSLRRTPGVVEVEVLSLPLDIGSGASLRGDAGARASAAEAPFALRLRWDSHVQS